MVETITFPSSKAAWLRDDANEEIPKDIWSYCHRVLQEGRSYIVIRDLVDPVNSLASSSNTFERQDVIPGAPANSIVYPGTTCAACMLLGLAAKRETTELAVAVHSTILMCDEDRSFLKDITCQICRLLASALPYPLRLDCTTPPSLMTAEEVALNLHRATCPTPPPPPPLHVDDSFVSGYAISGFIRVIASDDKSSGPPFLPRLTTPASRNAIADTLTSDCFDGIKHHISGCLEHHVSCALRKPAFLPKRLIRCVDRMVIETPINASYVALSYVWGDSTGDQLHSVFDGGSVVPNGDHKTIDDALEVTSRLGYDYLWVDRYCIKEVGNKKDMHEIGHMDMIYESAQLTLVAAAGVNPSHGLPGVSRPRSNFTFTLIMGSVELSTMHANLLPRIMLSKWYSRAWTLQEAIFSPRKLFFTKAGILMSCRTRLQAESFFGTYNPRTDLILTSTRDIFQCLTAYTERKLGRDLDALHAFLGFVRRFESTDGIFQCRGLPIRPMRYYSDSIQSPLTSTPKCFPICYALCWDRGTGRPAQERRAQYPSWSWMGWREIGYRNHFEMAPTNWHERLDTEVVVELQEGDHMAWHDFEPRCAYLRSGKLEAVDFLRITCHTLELDVVTRHDLPKSWIFKGGPFVKIVGKADHNCYEGLQLLCATQEAFLPKRQSPEGQLLGLMLGPLGVVKAPHVIVVHNVGDHWERLGSLTAIFAEHTLLVESEFMFEHLRITRRTIRLG